MKFLNPLFAALQFLTVLPVSKTRMYSLEDLGRAVALYPLVGVIMGGLLVGGNYLFSLLFPHSVQSALTLALWVILTGALHLDGFLDSCDGLLGGQTPEKRLEIMRDHNVGAFALAGGVLLLLLKYAAISALPQQWVFLFITPVVARWGMTLAINGYPYARAEGLGRAVKDNTRRPQIFWATLITLAAALFVGGIIFGGVAMLVAAAAMWGIGVFVLRRIPGMTGDTYGAVCEVCEVAVLLAFAVIG